MPSFQTEFDLSKNRQLRQRSAAVANLQSTKESSAGNTVDTVVGFQVLRRPVTALQRLREPFCEVVVRDFRGFIHAVNHIQDNAANRKGGHAATDLVLSKASQGDTDRDFYHYLTNFPSSRLMKSCTSFLRDEVGKAFGAFCFNFDICAFTNMRTLLSNFLATDSQDDAGESLPTRLKKLCKPFLPKRSTNLASNSSS